MYQFNIHAIPPLITAILSFILGIFVLKSNIKSMVNRLFFLLCLTACIWQFGFFMVYSSTNTNIALFWVRIGYLGVIFIPPIFLHFLVLFFKSKKYKKFILLSYIYSTIFFFLTRTNYFLDVQKYYWGYYTKGGFLHYIFLAIFIALWFLGLIIIYDGYKNRRSKSTLTRSRFKYLLLAFVFVTPAMIDYIACYGIKVYPVGFGFVIIWISILAYAIVKHRLMDIRLIIFRSIIYSCLVFLLGIIYVLVVSYLRSPLGKILGMSPAIMFLAAGATIAFGFPQIKKLLTKITDRWLYKGRYNPDVLLDQIGDITDSVLLLKPLCQSLLNLLYRELRVEKMAIITGDKRQETRSKEKELGIGN